MTGFQAPGDTVTEQPPQPDSSWHKHQYIWLNKDVKTFAPLAETCEKSLPVFVPVLFCELSIIHDRMNRIKLALLQLHIKMGTGCTAT